MVRTDLGMSPGKIASQAGHAYVGAIINALQLNPGTVSAYHCDFPESPGTKVCLEAKNLQSIDRAKSEAEAAGLPTFLVTDSGCKNFFDGQPTITALGIGPATKAQIKSVTKRFQLMK